MEEVIKAYQAKVSSNTPKFKFGVQVPKGIRTALRLDQANGDNLCKEAINK